MLCLKETAPTWSRFMVKLLLTLNLLITNAFTGKEH